MKTFITALFVSTFLFTPESAKAESAGFTDSNVTFYGEVRMIGAAQTVLLQSGTLEMTFVNQGNPANVVTLESDLRPTGLDGNKVYSYTLQIPLAYLPEAPRMGEFLAIGAQETDFKVTSITIDGNPATLPDGSKEFYSLSFASRAQQYRLDLIVEGESTDSDGDGLPDWWEELSGLNPSDASDANGDLDADGWNNLEEFRLGGNPAVSNRLPQLASAELLVPESGTAGVLLQVLDSDSSPEEIEVTLGTLPISGFVLRGVGDGPLTLADLQSGQVTIAHSDRALHEFSLLVSLNDGGEVQSGQVLVRVATPSTEQGEDASLWLDGYDLAAAGSSIDNWTDRSGNDHHAMQPSADYRPRVADHSADFSGSASAHLFFQDGAISSGDHTVLAAYRAADSADEAQTVLASNRGYLKLSATSQAISYPGSPRYQMDGLAVRGFENSSGRTSTSIFRRESDLLQNIFGLSYEGENIATEVTDPVIPTLGALRPAIPSGIDPVTEAFSGQLHELLVFPTALPEQKLRDVHDYLQSKWSDAVIWDLSTELKAIALIAASRAKPQIIRGGHGDDLLGGGSADDTISGGPGADRMSGGDGSDRFVFGGVDTGRDLISDYDMTQDVIDLSALFWGQSGDARNFLTVRLETNFSTPIPTIDSGLLVQRPDGSVQEIVLQDLVVGPTQLVQLIVEGRIRMGGLSIPTGVQLGLAPGTSTEALSESLDQPFSVEITRSGEGVAGALEVPVGLFEDALGADLVIEGASEIEGQRAMVSFARGETSKTLTFRPIPDLETEGDETLQVAVLPSYKYSVTGSAVEQTVGDNPMVWLEILQANAVSDRTQPALVRVRRDGDLSESVVIDLKLSGSAEEGVHIAEVPNQVTIPAGQAYSQIEIEALAEGLTNDPKMVVLQLTSNEAFQLGNPHEAILYVATSAETANDIGFDRWLQTSTDGAIGNLADLARIDPARAGDYLQAYAFGLDSVNELKTHRIDLRIVDGRPEITAEGSFSAAEVRWGVQASGDLNQWANAGESFVEVPNAGGLKLLGDPLTPGEGQKFYKINLTLDSGQLAGSSITALTRASKFGITGDASWSAETVTGDLKSSGGLGGAINRIIAEVDASTSINFEMEIDGAGEGPGDALVFYIDGIKVAETDGPVVTVEQDLEGSGVHLLMWEFKRGSGDAVIRNVVQ
jgi:hypothetical protein